jgi:titin
VLLAAAPTLGSLPATTNVLSVTGTPKPGGTVAVSGDGFAPYTSISFGVYTTATGLTRVTTVVTTDGTGAFSQDITIPAAVTVGARTLVAAGLPPTGTTLRYAKAAITVTAS